METFKKIIGFRLEADLKKEIEEIVRLNKHCYETSSQFVRVAIIQLIKKTKRRLNEDRKVRVIRER